LQPRRKLRDRSRARCGRRLHRTLTMKAAAGSAFEAQTSGGVAHPLAGPDPALATSARAHYAQEGSDSYTLFAQEPHNASVVWDRHFSVSHKQRSSEYGDVA
jgi:hypothetical protein